MNFLKKELLDLLNQRFFIEETKETILLRKQQVIRPINKNIFSILSH